MTDAVLPEPVFPPTVAVISADQHRAIPEAVQQRRELAVNPFQAGALAAGTFNSAAILIAKGHTGAGPTFPARAFMPVGHMSFAHVEEHEPGLIRRRCDKALLEPRQLALQAPGVARELKLLKRLGQHRAGLAGGVEPIHRTAAKGAVALLTETLNDVGPTEAEALLAIVAGMAGNGHAEQLARLGVEPGLCATDHAWGKAHPKGGMTAVGEIAGGQGLVERSDGSQMRQRTEPPQTCRTDRSRD